MSGNRARSTPTEVGLRAPAKINWTLAVTGRRADGYHEVDTILQNVSLYDDLRFAVKRSATCAIRCDDRSVPVGRGNLMWRAWDILRRADPERVGGIEIDLQKRIPMGAGLGGGSADAAATMIAINRLFALRLHREELARLAGSLGSDVPFFIRGGVARCRGRGERVEPLLSRLPPIHLVIVFPGFESPTAEAYARLKPSHFAQAESGEKAARAIVRGQKGALKKSLANTFHDALTPRDPRYTRLLAAMKETGLNPVMLSGSGSACFGWAESALGARSACAALSCVYDPVFAVRTLRSGIRPAGG